MPYPGVPIPLPPRSIEIPDGRGTRLDDVPVRDPKYGIGDEEEGDVSRWYEREQGGDGRRDRVE